MYRGGCRHKMVYFLNEVDRKVLLNKLLPLAREVGISAELRGWSWSQEPIKPLYDVRMPMYLVSSKYCPTGRDSYLQLVKGVKPKMNYKIGLGKLIHGAISDSFLSFLERKELPFGVWWTKVRREEIPMLDEKMKGLAESIWNYVHISCKVEYENHRMQQPYATDRDIMATAVPFLIEHKVTGELLGLSGLLSPDCYDYLRKIIFDVKVHESSEMEAWHRLYATGYALVLESIYETPIDVGCTVYISWRARTPHIKRDLFFINEDLRRWWIEERDLKMEIVAQKKDPGTPNICPGECIYWDYCH